MDKSRKYNVVVAQQIFVATIVSWMTLGASVAEVSLTGTFAEQVASIDKYEGEIITDLVLLGDPGFIRLSNTASNNIVPCISYLLSVGHSRQEREIAILSMHSLGPAEYVNFLAGILELYDHNSLSLNELRLALGPTYDFSTTLIDNYERADVRAILKSILKRTGIDANDRAGILEILSGQALKEKEFFLQNCCTPAPKN